MSNIIKNRVLQFTGAILLMTLISCGGSSGSSNGGNVTTQTNPITIDNAGVVPVIGNSSTSSVIYVHNNSNQTISGITYSSQLNTGNKTFLNKENMELCSSIPAHQSCPLAITTPKLNKSTPQESSKDTAN